MNLKKTLKYFSLADVRVLAIGTLVSSSSSSEKKTEKTKIEIGTMVTTKPCSYEEKDGKLTAGLGAGGHWDPKETKKHGFPWQDDAHLGDFPALTVLHDGTATNPVLAPRIKRLDEVRGHSIMIHVGGDNHSDHPAPLGGGGARMACGVIK